MCEHLQFEAKVDINRVEPETAFNAAVRIKCKDCGLPFSFSTPSKPDGDLDVSRDGLTARLAIVPSEELFPPL